MFWVHACVVCVVLLCCCVCVRVCATGSVKTWKKRWATLDNFGELNYYKSATDPVPAGTVNVSEAQGVRYQALKKDPVDAPHSLQENPSFAIITFRRTYYFVCADEADYRCWVEALASLHIPLS
eukprot:m.80074 g.80074  ORF g.80074 m.80074 type:complete len:124 (+) comp12592_c0_seq4:102-473(+)